MKRMNNPDRRAQRRAEAAERQAHYDSMTVEQRIAAAKSRRGESRKELARLYALAS